MSRPAATYLAITVTLFVLDMLWLLGIARDWYQQGIGHLMADQPQWAPAALFYLLFPAGLLVFAVMPGHAHGVARATLRGGLFGFFAYATYDLTNLATLKDWPIGLSLLDIAWGTLAGSAASAAGAWTARAPK